MSSLNCAEVHWSPYSVGSMVAAFMEAHPGASDIAATCELGSALRGEHPEVQARLFAGAYVVFFSIGYGLASKEKTLFEHFVYRLPGEGRRYKQAQKELREYAASQQCSLIVVGIGNEAGDSTRARILERDGYEQVINHFQRRV